MCGGIVALLGSRHRIAVQVQDDGAAVASSRSGFALQFAYNTGRIGSYTVAGALAGAVGSSAWLAGNLLPVQQIAFIAVNIVLIVLGFALIGVHGGLRRLRVLERFGTAVWRRIAPSATRMLGASSVPGAFAAGAAWGWLPCGMVYGVLVAALVSGSAVSGAALMLAFGAGTLPNLLALGMAAQRASRWIADSRTRAVAGIVIVLFGIAGLARIDPLAHLHAVVDACISWVR